MVNKIKGRKRIQKKDVNKIWGKVLINSLIFWIGIIRTIEA